MSAVDSFVWWLGLGDNTAEWARLQRALVLSDGFALLLVVVADARTGELVELLVEAEAKALGRKTKVVSPLDFDATGPIAALTATTPARPLAILTTLEASSTDQEALLRCLAVLNGKRDQLVTRLAAPLVLILRADARRQLAEIAPDLLSVHAAQFHFARASEPRGAPPWLLPAFEAVGTLGLDPNFGPVDRSSMPTFVEDVPELVEPLVGRTFELGLIEGRVLGGARSLCVYGAHGSGRRTVVRAVLERTHERWEQVVWVSARLLDDARGVIDALVAALGDEHERPPLDELDLHQRYRELTARHAVFIVVEDVARVVLPEPSAPSILVEIRTQDPGGAVEIPRLDQTDVETLWSSLTSLPPPDSVKDFTWGSPLAVTLLARWIDSGGAPPTARSQGSWLHTSMGLLDALTRDVAVNPRSALRGLFEANYFGRCFPLDEGMDPSMLERLHLADVEGGLVTCRVPSLYSEPEVSVEVPSIAYAVFAGPPMLEALHEFHARGVHEFAHRVPDEINSSDFEEEGAWRATLLSESAAALLPARRADFLAWLEQPLAALEASLAAHSPEARARFESHATHFGARRAALLRLLIELRPPRGTRASARRALFDWEASGAADGLSAALRIELRRALGIDERRQPPSSDRAVALVRALARVDNGDDHSTLATLRQACERSWSSLGLPRRHLAWSGRAWLDIHHARHACARESLAEAEVSARAWATPFALLRARLLQLERAIEIGDLLHAADAYDPILSRCNEVYGPTHPATLALIARGIAVFAGVARAERAHALAAACTRQLAYADEVGRATLYDLGAWWSVHDEARALAVRTRWTTKFHDEPWPFDD